MKNGSVVKIFRNPTIDNTSIDLPSSKSESNRALIINQFAKGVIHNLSEARDTQIMMSLLKAPTKELNVLDAGTAMRFLVAYYALTDQNKILTGTPRMCERPIGILVDALREIGAEINYLQNEGFPPLETVRFQNQKRNKITIRGDVSSQFISAIMMLAPTLPLGLNIKLTGKVASKPYIMMTLQLMKQFGANVEYNKRDEIKIKPTNYSSAEFSIESDWSGAGYWFSIVALAEKAEVILQGLKPNSLQGDIRILEIMEHLGVKSEFMEKGLKLTKIQAQNTFAYDFNNCPDLGQTVAVVCASKGISAEFTGLESLRIKETDRIHALQNELDKIGARLEEINGKRWDIQPTKNFVRCSNLSFETYDDHRMAMAFSPLATLSDVEIKNPSAVNKSYPSFWKHMEKAGFRMEFK